MIYAGSRDFNQGDARADVYQQVGVVVGSSLSEVHGVSPAIRENFPRNLSDEEIEAYTLSA